MKLKRKNRSVFFRGMVLATALAFTVLCFPVNALKASAETLQEYTDYTFMTIGTTKEEVPTTVVKGGTYYIPKAYIGGNRTRVVGGEISDAALDTNVTLKSSKITVKYSSDVLGGVKDGVAVNSNDEADTDGFVKVSADNSFSFEANKVGSYTVTYSYTYDVDGVIYTNSYDLTVTSEITDADINFKDNEKLFMPSILDLSQAEKSDGTYKDMYITIPELLDEEGEEIDTTAEDFGFITSRTNIGDKNKQLLIEVSASTNTTKVAVSGDAENGYYVAGSVFADANYGAGKYTVTYSYYENGQFVASTTKTTQVYSKADAYYKDYALRLQLSSDFVDNGQTGVETTLPTAKGLTSTSSTPASEAVDIYYTVTVYYKTSVSGSYKLIDATKYNASVEADEEKIVNEDGTLVDPTKFKPLDDGYYSFVYEAYDYYYDEEAGKTAAVNKNHYFKTDLGRYEYVNIKDEKSPTPTVYVATKDGSLDDEDASYRIATRANPQSVVVYAIGIDDNVSKAGDEGVVLTRKIMTDETVSKLTLSSTDEKDYSSYNLVFNYRGRDGLKTNNFLIRKQIEKEEVAVADTEEATLAWLAENKYLIVVDNANYETIYDLFKDANVFDETVTDAEKALAWFKGDDALAKGFAYVNCDQTFGASTSTKGGMGVGQYYIHYIAKDAAGNETDITKKLYVREVEDIESPDISFQTSLADSYLPTSTVTFDAPTSSDNIDERMVTKVMYRYLDKNDEVVAVYDKDDSTKELSTNDLAELWADLGTDPDGSAVRDDNNTLITSKYAAYHNENANDGYVDITDVDAKSYSINLKEVEGATKLQIVVYVYDDAGNPMLYGQTIAINNVQDEYPPQLMSVETTEGSFVTEYEQGATVTLPTITVADDAVGYMTYDVKVDYIKDDQRISQSARESTADRESQEVIGKFTVKAGNFVAAYDGNYQVSVAVKDANNKTIVVFVNYEISPRAIVQEPVINSTLESQTIELDDNKTIEIPTPTVNFELGDSTTYDVFEGNKYVADETYVIRGLNSDGKVTNWTTSNPKVTNSTFKPDATGEYEIQYLVRLEAYNQKVLTYNEGKLTYDEATDEVTYVLGGYYSYKTSGVEIRIGENGEYKISDNGSNYVITNEDNEIVIYRADNNFVTDGVISQDEMDESSNLRDSDLNQLFKDLRVYSLKSDIYTITVKDTQGPKLAEYDYSDQQYMSVHDFKENGITVYGIEASDASNIDWSKSQVVLSWKRANGTSAGDSGSTTYRNETAAKNNVYKSSATNLNGTYTITYTVYDMKGNSSTASYSISVGDNEAPKIKFPEDFIKTSYTLKDKLVIDLDPTKVVVTDNNPMPEDSKPVVKLINTSTNKEVSYTVEGTKYIFDSFDSSDEYGVGSYKLTIEVEDAVGHVTTEEFTFDVSTKTRESVQTYKIVGTILIVVSVLVLAGVIVYFIVSKVKLDKELKK